MTLDARPAAPGADPAVIRAGEPGTEALCQVIAGAFFGLEVSRWLIPDPEDRRRIFPSYFRLHVEHALADGIAHTTAGRDAVALWLPAGEARPEPPDGYAERLAAVTGPWAGRFRAFGQTLDRHHPAGSAHHHLAILAVRPDRQGQGTGTALLLAHHAYLDTMGLPAYLEAANARSCRLYLAHGYKSQGDLIVLPGAVMYPLVRQPQPGHRAAPGHPAASAGQQPASGGAR